MGCPLHGIFDQHTCIRSLKASGLFTNGTPREIAPIVFIVAISQRMQSELIPGKRRKERPHNNPGRDGTTGKRGKTLENPPALSQVCIFRNYMHLRKKKYFRGSLLHCHSTLIICGHTFPSLRCFVVCAGKCKAAPHRGYSKIQ